MKEIISTYPTPSNVDMDIEQFTKLMHELTDIANSNIQPGTSEFDRFCKLVVICEQYQASNMVMPGVMMAKERLNQKYTQ